MHLNRSLGRGLKLLAIINTAGDHRVSSLARAVALPRSTAFRILCTLVEEGYVWRDPATDLYHPTALVLALADGFDATARLVKASQTVVSELGRELIWPVMLATLSGTSIVLRQTTDAASPLAAVRYRAGYRTGALDHAAGLVLLAFSHPQTRRMTLNLIYREDAGGRPAVAAADAERSIAEAHSVGFACLTSAGHAAERVSLAVPIRADGDTLAALSVRFAASAVTQQVIRERFLPALRNAARRIAEAYARTFCADPGSAARLSALDRTEA
jgi:IclR family mhp operon transcriptional activator